MEVRAVTRYVRIAPSKGMDFSRVIQGKSYADALAIAEISPRKAAKLFAKTLKCAKAAAAESGRMMYIIKSVVALLITQSSIRLPNSSALFFR